MDAGEVRKNSKGKPTTYTRFKVTEMEYNREKECFTKLIVCDDKGRQRYSLNGSKAEKPIEKPAQTSVNQYVKIENNETYVLTRQGYKKPSELNLSTLQQMYNNKLYQEAQFVIQLAINDKEAEQPA